MKGINKVILVGNVGSDPDDFSGGLRFSLATNDIKGDSVQWHKVTLFDPVATSIKPYLTKGKQVYVEGRIEYHEHNNRTYTNIVSSDIQLLGGNNG